MKDKDFSQMKFNSDISNIEVDNSGAKKFKNLFKNLDRISPVMNNKQGINQPQKAYVTTNTSENDEKQLIMMKNTFENILESKEKFNN